MSFFAMMLGFFLLLHVPPLGRWKWLRERRAKAAFALGFGLFVTGTMHFTGPERFLPMMPPWLPWHLGLVYLSGGFELLAGAGLLLPQTRRWAAWGVIALFIAIFPANLHVALSGGSVAGLPEARWYYWARLPFQGVYIAWAYWCSRPTDVQINGPR